MPKKFQSPKGVKDVLPSEQACWQHVENIMRHTARVFGYEKINLPVFEETALFLRGVGEGTDIVDKEMYTFMDKGNQSMTLRPEFTAGVMRAYLQHGMASWPTPVKLWSTGPVFRYERPQAGRFRQHTQFNVEALGEQDPALDFEIMSIAWTLYNQLGFKNLGFQINSIGCPACRPAYLKKLSAYYKTQSNHICEDCKKRLQKNPLRVLDCKNSSCQPVIEKAPPMIENLCKECDDHFKKLLDYLGRLKRPYQINHRLVRGLDYYTKTVFEVWAEGIGAQNAVCGGGRYDGLTEVLGGPPTPAVGFASGIERIVMILQNQDFKPPLISGSDIYIATMGEAAKSKGVELLTQLREKNLRTIMGYGDRSFKAQMREADRRGVKYTILLGEEEMQRNEAVVKCMEDSSQESMPLESLSGFFLKQGLSFG